MLDLGRSNDDEKCASLTRHPSPTESICSPSSPLAPIETDRSRRCPPPPLLPPSFPFRLPSLPALFLLLCLLVLWLCLRRLSPLLPSGKSPMISLPSNFSTYPPISSENEHLASAFGPVLWPQLARLDCARLLLNSDNGSTNLGHRIVQNDPPHLDMSCAAIRARWHFAGASATTAREKRFPLAFARTVYRDYLMEEMLFSVQYAPHNSYCYALDAKADAQFKRRVRALALCFPANVVVARAEFNVNSNGKNVTRAQLACMQALLQIDAEGGGRKKKRRKWKYAFLLQNHDIPLRTNAELVEILRVYNGTNDVATRQIVPISVNLSLDWSIQSIHLYREGYQPPVNLTHLHHTKSLNLVALSRPAVEFSLRVLNLEPLIKRLEQSKYGMDEVLFSTLNSNLPDFPGGFTRQCLQQSPPRPVPNMGRYTIWRGVGLVTGTGGCKSRHFRHDVCVYGMEDLAHIGRAKLHFFHNKMMPSFDFGAIFCWLRSLAVRQQAQRRKNTPPKVNHRFYAQLAHVRYNHLRAEGRLAEFAC